MWDGMIRGPIVSSQSALDRFSYRERGAGGQRQHFSLQGLSSPLRMSQIGADYFERHLPTEIRTEM